MNHLDAKMYKLLENDAKLASKFLVFHIPKFLVCEIRTNGIMLLNKNK